MNRNIRGFILGVNNIVQGEGDKKNTVISANFNVIGEAQGELDFDFLEELMELSEEVRMNILNELDKYDYLEVANLECFTRNGEKKYEVVEHIGIILKLDNGDYIVDCVESDFRVTTTVALCS